MLARGGLTAAVVRWRLLPVFCTSGMPCNQPCTCLACLPATPQRVLIMQLLIMYFFRCGSIMKQGMCYEMLNICWFEKTYFCKQQITPRT